MAADLQALDSDVIERVAHAMHESENKNSGWTWEECSPIERDGWRELAVAAIAALRAEAGAVDPSDVDVMRDVYMSRKEREAYKRILAIAQARRTDRE